MANHKSAKKRARQSLKRQARNRSERSRTRSSVKAFRVALESGDKEGATEKLREAERRLRKAATKGVIPAKRASRSVSRLAHALAQAK